MNSETRTSLVGRDTGRWKTTAMPMRYGEDIQAGLGGMARTAKAQGRAK
jgi:hypothetical protein